MVWGSFVVLWSVRGVLCHVWFWIPAGLGQVYVVSQKWRSVLQFYFCWSCCCSVPVPLSVFVVVVI